MAYVHAQPVLLSSPGQHQEWRQKAPQLVQQEIEVPYRGFDWWTFIILCLTWIALAGSSATLLWVTHWSTSGKSLSGAAVTPDEIATTLLITALPILIASILNEVLIERCWRRIEYVALGTRHPRGDASLARRLRAANFDIASFIKHAWRARPAGVEWLAGFSYCLLRWGTIVSIASVQLAVTWKTSGTEYLTVKKHAWVMLPIVLHGVCVFGAFVVWLKPPWRLFSKRYSDAGLLRKYWPYLQRVRGGTLVDAQTVANYLERPKDLHRKLKTGRQMGTKIAGLWGALVMFLPPGLAWILCRYTNFVDLLTVGEMRMAVHLIFLIQNVCYIFALDFAIWNVSLDGLCKGGKPKNLHFLGYSSGTVLMFKALKFRRPVRATLFLIMFWGQACLMRGLTVFYAFCASALSYDLDGDMMAFADPWFWVGWAIVSAVIAVPPFLLWVLVESDSPVRDADGWVWANVARGALYGDGHYGVKNGRACWGVDVRSFRECAGEWME